MCEVVNCDSEVAASGDQSLLVKDRAQERALPWFVVQRESIVSSPGGGIDLVSWLLLSITAVVFLPVAFLRLVACGP